MATTSVNDLVLLGHDRLVQLGESYLENVQSREGAFLFFSYAGLALRSQVAEMVAASGAGTGGGYL